MSDVCQSTTGHRVFGETRAYVKCDGCDATFTDTDNVGNLPMHDTATMTETAPMFVVIAGHYWGRGDSLDKAKDACRNVGGKLTRYVAYRLPMGASDPYVSGMGQLCWTWEPAADRSAEPTIVAKRGVDVSAL